MTLASVAVTGLSFIIARREHHREKIAEIEIPQFLELQVQGQNLFYEKYGLSMDLQEYIPDVETVKFIQVFKKVSHDHDHDHEGEAAAEKKEEKPSAAADASPIPPLPTATNEVPAAEAAK